MTHNPLDHSYLLDINLTVHAELADKFYDASGLGGYKNKRLTQLQVLLANLISNHQTDRDLYTSVSLDNSHYKPHSRYNSHSIGKGFINLIRDLAAGDWLIDKGMGKSTVKRVFSSIRSIINLTITEKGLEGTNGFLGTFIPDDLKEKKRKPIPTHIIKDIQTKCIELDDDLRWLIALLSDTGMRLGEAVGLLKSDIVLNTDTPHLNLIPHPWRRLKTTGSEKKIPLVGASLWSAKRIKQSDPTNQFAFPRYCNGQSHNSNSASAALNKWLRTHAPEGCVVHSFRHSMRDRLRAVECPKEIIDQIGGWSSSDVGESYGEGFPLSILSSYFSNISLS